MSGLGSGNRWQSGKDTTDDMRAIDVRYLHREGLLRAGNLSTLTWHRNGIATANIKILANHAHITLIYKCHSHGQEWEEKNYTVPLERTSCHYGGCRVWFLCPCCHKRVAKIYGGKIFACRHCHDLAYKSQREGNLDRLVRKAEKIRERLGWELGILNGHGWKPKGMHWKTFHRLTALHDDIEQPLLSGIMEHFHQNNN